MADTKLKPCPFCGGEAERRDIVVNERTLHYISCSNPKCLVSASTEGFLKKASATRVWNRRVNEDGGYKTETMSV